MSSDQTTIRAVVHSVSGNEAFVKVEHGGCGRCHEEGGCGGQQLTQVFCGGPKTYFVENSIGAAVGERVTIAIAAGRVRQTANFAYGLPLLATIAGALIGSQIGTDVVAVAGAGIGLVISFLYVIARSRGSAGNLSERPHIVSRS